MSSPALLDHLVQHINADVFHFFLVLIASSNALNLFSHSSQSHSDAKVKTKVLELIRDWKGAVLLNLCSSYRYFICNSKPDDYGYVYGLESFHNTYSALERNGVVFPVKAVCI